MNRSGVRSDESVWDSLSLPEGCPEDYKPAARGSESNNLPKSD